MGRYRAVIVGCGQIARSHATGYQGVEGIDLVAVADPNPRVRGDFQAQDNVSRGYADFREMLEKERPDLVSICTWHLLHAPQTVAAAEYGPKGILCEKPMAVGLAAADRMIEVCESRGSSWPSGISAGSTAPGRRPASWWPPGPWARRRW